MNKIYDLIRLTAFASLAFLGLESGYNTGRGAIYIVGAMVVAFMRRV